MSKKKTKTTAAANDIDSIIEALQDENLERCAVIVLTTDGQLKIGSFNIEEEVDMIELFQKTANFMIDSDQSNFTIH
jgi:uncharacterized protein YdiU (UPF0061 family)